MDNDKIQSDVKGNEEYFLIKEREISALLSATEQILKSNDFNFTAKKVFDSCAKVIGAKAGYVALLSDDGEENELLFLEDGGMRCTVSPELPTDTPTFVPTDTPTIGYTPIPTGTRTPDEFIEGEVLIRLKTGLNGQEESEAIWLLERFGELQRVPNSPFPLYLLALYTGY